jgi:hypothetical protein
MQPQPLFQVIRTRTCDPWPNQVLAIETYHNETVARAVAEIWSRAPAVRAGREKVRIVKHLA